MHLLWPVECAREMELVDSFTRVLEAYGEHCASGVLKSSCCCLRLDDCALLDEPQEACEPADLLEAHAGYARVLYAGSTQQPRRYEVHVCALVLHLDAVKLALAVRLQSVQRVLVRPVLGKYLSKST